MLKRRPRLERTYLDRGARGLRHRREAAAVGAPGYRHVPRLRRGSGRLVNRRGDHPAVAAHAHDQAGRPRDVSHVVGGGRRGHGDVAEPPPRAGRRSRDRQRNNIPIANARDRAAALVEGADPRHGGVGAVKREQPRPDRRRLRMRERGGQRRVARDPVELGSRARPVCVVDRERGAHRLRDLGVRLPRLAVGRDAEEHQSHSDHRDDHDDREEEEQAGSEAHNRCYPASKCRAREASATLVIRREQRVSAPWAAATIRLAGL